MFYAFDEYASVALAQTPRDFPGMLYDYHEAAIMGRLTIFTTTRPWSAARRVPLPQRDDILGSATVVIYSAAARR